MENPIMCGLSNFLIGLAECTNSESLYIDETEPLVTILPTFLSVMNNINENARRKERVNLTCCQLSDLSVPEETNYRIGRQLHYFGKTCSLLSKLLAKGVLLAITLDNKNSVFDNYELVFEEISDCLRNLNRFCNQSCQSLLKLEQARQLTQALNEKMLQGLANSVNFNQINDVLIETTAILNQINGILQEVCL